MTATSLSVPDSPVRNLGVSVNFGADQIVVAVRGELDLATAPQLACVLAAVVGRAAETVLDLAELEFLDPAGLRVIAATSIRLRQSGRELTLRSVPAGARRVLDITGVVDLVRIEPSDPQVAAIGPGRLGGGRSAADLPRRATRSVRAELRAVGSRPAPDDVTDTTLRLVVALARTAVGGADGVSVSLDRRGRLTTVAATDETILEMDHNQYSTAQGPCVAAAAEGQWFYVESLTAEDRWPDFIPLAIEGGIGSILSNPLLVGARSVGALNMYSRAETAFGAGEKELATMFAGLVSGILTDAGTDGGTEELGRRLQGALRVREVIAQAQGVLMERTGVLAEEAVAALRRSAAAAESSVRQRAVDVVASTHRRTGHGQSEPVRTRENGALT